MNNLTQFDRIKSGINELEEKEKTSDNSNDQHDNGISIESVFGLWKDRDVTKGTLRKKAWMKD